MGKFHGLKLVHSFCCYFATHHKWKHFENQWQGFYDFVRGMKFDDFKGVLLEIVDGQLLPGELSGVEEKVDKIALVIYNLLDAIHQTIEAYQDLLEIKN